VELRQLNEQLRRRALEDPLTGLPNRVLFSDRVEHAFAAQQRNGQQLAVLYLDLDDFKLVNDRLGHEAGDRLLVGVAERLRGCLRPSDTAARLSGDEFAVLLTAPADTSTALEVAERIAVALQDPFALTGSVARASASVGVALSSARTASAGELIRDADAAMYRAKALGRGRYALFEPDMHAAAVRRLERKTELATALRHDEFTLRYQPVVNLRTGLTAAVEALVRWRHPNDGLLPPADFIDAADDAGLGDQVGRWILTTACRQVAGWSGVSEPALGLSVNLSARQLLHPKLLDDVRAALSLADLSPSRVTVEVSEAVLVASHGIAIEHLRRLDALGVAVAIDDFGAGHGALALLRRLPLSVVKLAPMLLAGDGADLALAGAVVTVCRAVGVTTVAKGLEAPRQWDAARSLGCDFVQGYLIARPLTVPRLLRRVRSEQAGIDLDQAPAGFTTSASAGATTVSRETVIPDVGLRRSVG
jgi:diguanylate cyclase (GGDEF)-like protein